MPEALAINWDAVRSAIENGVPYEKAASNFGVKASSIRQKASRGGWITPLDLRKLNPKVPDRVTNAVAKAQVVTAIEESMAEQGVAYERMMARKLVPIMRDAVIAAPKNWKDAEIVDKMARRALHLESADNQVNLAIVPGGWAGLQGDSGHFGGSGVATFEVETTEPPPATLEDSGQG